MVFFNQPLIGDVPYSESRVTFPSELRTGGRPWNALSCRGWRALLALHMERSLPASEAMKPSGLDETALQMAATAYSGASRTHSESDLRIFFTRCSERDLGPLTARRAQIDLYARWCPTSHRPFPFPTCSSRPY